MSSMKTQIVSPEDLSQAVSFLKKGCPIAFPTETVYGLGAPVFDRKAIEKVFAIKERPSDNPLIVHVSSLNQVEQIAQNLPPIFFELVEKYWPGPLTLVVEKKPLVPEIVSAGLSSVAIRMPSDLIARRLIEEVGPLVAPSANLSGRPSPTSAEDVFEDLDGKIPLIIDGGRCSCGIESTVLSLVAEVPTLLRPGVITLEGVLEIKQADQDTKVASPGMKYRHYAPKAKVRLVYSQNELKGPYILSMRPKEGMRLLNEQTLYRELRNADRCGVSEILIDCSNDLLENQAMMNRLAKAASNGKNS